MDKRNVEELSVCLRGLNHFDRFFCTSRKSGRMSSPQARPKLSGKHGFQTRGAGDEREVRVGNDGNERSARAGSDGKEKSLFSLRPYFPKWETSLKSEFALFRISLLLFHRA